MNDTYNKQGYILLLLLRTTWVVYDILNFVFKLHHYIGVLNLRKNSKTFHQNSCGGT